VSDRGRTAEIIGVNKKGIEIFKYELFDEETVEKLVQGQMRQPSILDSNNLGLSANKTRSPSDNNINAVGEANDSDGSGESEVDESLMKDAMLGESKWQRMSQSVDQMSHAEITDANTANNV
jgi:hypothetical protein